MLRGPDPIRDALAQLGRGVVFVQVGANDGRANDPIHRLVRWSGWRGVAVEAVPAIYERLAANYRRYPQVKAVHAAIGPVAGEMLPFYYLEAAPDDPFYAERIGSFKREHVVMHPIPDVERRLKTCMVETATINDLISEQAPDIGLLHTDAEGFDEKLIPTVDFARWPLHTIMFETAHMSPDGRAQCESLLREHGFARVAASPMDEMWRR